MALGKGIPVINGFDLNSQLPLDSRSVADTKENMQKLVTDASVGDGQLCYCKEDKKLYVLKESVWNEVGGGGGGGKSVPPTLNLIDFENGGVRTTITEEEYNNLNNGLYNQVLYTTGSNIILALGPSKLFSMAGSYYFTQFKISMNADETFSYSSMVACAIIIDAKNTSGEYPITVFEEAAINPLASGGSSIDKLDIVFNFNGTTTLTQEQVTLINSYVDKYVYVKFDEGIARDNAYIGYVLSLGDFGTVISIVSGVNISGNLIIQSFISIQGTTAMHKEKTIAFSTENSDKFLKTNAQGEPEWSSVPASTITITFEN